MATPVTLLFDLIAIDNSSAVFKRVGDAATLSGAQAESGMARFGKAVAGLATGFAIAGAAATVISVKMAADFQTATNQLVTSAGETKNNLDLVRKGLLDMAGQVGVSATELAKGMYQVESAGFHGAAGLDVMRAAAEGAKAEGANMETVANALTTVLNNYGKDVQNNAVKGTDFLVASVSLGKTRMEDFAGSISNVLPVAKAVGLSLGEVGGAMATMTSEGISSDQAATYLRQTIVKLADQTPKAKNEMKALGLESINVAGHLGKVGLAGTLQELTDAIAKHMGPGGLVELESLKKAGQNAQKFQAALTNLPPAAQTYIGALTTMVGGQKTMMGALSLTGDHMHTFVDDTAKINAAMDAGKGHVNGWEVVQGSFNQKLSEFMAGLGAVAIKIGTALLPVLTKVVGFLAADLPAAFTFAQHVVAEFLSVWKGDGATGWFGLNADLLIGNLALAVKDLVGKVKDAFSAIWTTIQNFVSSDLFKLYIVSLVAEWKTLFAALGVGLVVIKDVFNFINAHTGMMGLLTSIVLGGVLAWKAWTTAVAVWAAATKIATAVQAVFNAVMDANPIMLVVVGIAALAAGLVYAYTHFQTFHDIVDTVFHFVKTIAMDVFDFFKANWPLLGMLVAGPFGVAVLEIVQHWGAIKDAVMDGIHTVTGFFSRMYDDVTGWFTKTWRDTAKIVSGMYDDVTGWFNRLWKTIEGIGASIAGFFKDHWRLILTIVTAGVGLVYVIVQDHWKAISGFFERMYKDVTGFVSRMWHDVAGFFGAIWSSVTGWVAKMWSDVTGFFSSKGKEVSTSASATGQQVGGVFATLWAEVTGWVSKIWHDVTGFFTSMAKDVAAVAVKLWQDEVVFWTNIWNAVSGFAARMWHDVVDFFKSMAADVWGIVSPFVDRIISGWTNIYNGVTGIARNIWTDVKGFFGSMRDDVVGIFNDIVTKVGSVWSGIQDKMAKPVQWVVDNVYDKGIVGIWNAVAGVLHEDSLKLSPFHFAAGGEVPGNHNRDTVPIYATPGEVVVPKAVVQRSGGAQALMSALGFAGGGGQGGHYFLGGLVGDIGSGIGNVAGAVGHGVANAAGAVVDVAGAAAGELAHLARGALAATVSPVVHGFESAADGTLGGMGGMGSLMAKGTHSLGDALLNWIKGQDSKDQAASSLGGDVIAYTGGANTIGLIEQLVRGLGFGMQVTSTFRPGGNSYHARSEAVDFSDGTDTAAEAGLTSAWAAKYGASTAELIHAGGLNIKDGKNVGDGMGMYGAATMAGHHNHVHIALSPESIARGSQGLSKMGGTATGGGGAARWAANILAVLGMLGQPASMLNGVESLINSESGGDPNAVNNWDSNAKAGHPSKGLMQTIGGTFELYRSHALPDNIFDPTANIYAGIAYALNSYGPAMLMAGGRHGTVGGYVGYEAGTSYVPRTGLALLHEGEAVIPKAQNAARGGGQFTGTLVLDSGELLGVVHGAIDQAAHTDARFAGYSHA